MAMQKIFSQVKALVPMTTKVKFFSGDLSDKAHRSRHICVECMPTEECPDNQETWKFHSRKALTEHYELDHKDIVNNEDYVECTQCGGWLKKGEEDKCLFLAPHQPSCAKKANYDPKKIDEILIQQYRDRK